LYEPSHIAGEPNTPAALEASSSQARWYGGLSLDGDNQGDLAWKRRFERLWIATGVPPTRTISTRGKHRICRDRSAARGTPFGPFRLPQPRGGRIESPRVNGGGHANQTYRIDHRRLRAHWTGTCWHPKRLNRPAIRPLGCIRAALFGSLLTLAAMRKVPLPL
jgi:hypothetical protein